MEDEPETLHSQTNPTCLTIADGGQIVNIGSIAGRTAPRIAGSHYAAAKAGLGGLTRALAFDLAPHGITVNCLAPGWVASNMTAPIGSTKAEAAAATIPVRRVGEPADIAGAVTYLASDSASYLTGTTIEVNGGAFTM
jgi:3-oxoacyl-[acyl-carrier protein] reductase